VSDGWQDGSETLELLFAQFRARQGRGTFDLCRSHFVSGTILNFTRPKEK